MTLPDPIVFSCATRYALGRQTGVSEDIAGQVQAFAAHIRRDPGIAQAICRDAREWLDGDEHDRLDAGAVRAWEKAIKALEVDA